MIAAELGAPPEDVSESFDPRPLAAASLGQVHRASVSDGREVAVRVQRPNSGALTFIDTGMVGELGLRRCASTAAGASS